MTRDTDNLIFVEGSTDPDTRFHDGALPHALGAKCYQIMRSHRTEEGPASWTYNHAPMLAWWQGRFFVEYLSNPVTEHLPPSRTLLQHSEDGRHWSEPVVVFPPVQAPSAPYQGPGKELLSETVWCNCHQRMGFFVSSSGRLLVSAFYGISPEIHIGPNNGYGVLRAVREIYADLTLSPIYSLRWNAPAGYTQENAPLFPAYTESPDSRFVEACAEFLSNRLVVQQWWEEQRFDSDLFTVPGGAALSTYTRRDGSIVGLYKGGQMIFSEDDGEHWSQKHTSETLITNTGKIWGQRTGDGSYALVYNPTRDGAHRWPLAIVTGLDGVHFGDMAAIVPEISPRRYMGGLKNLGAQYIRGIHEHNPQPEDNKLRLTYSVNKEDIWVSEIPLPITSIEPADVAEDFASKATIEKWNICAPKWCPVRAEREMLILADRDPYDRPRAERIFPASASGRIEVKLSAGSLQPERAIWVWLEDRQGREAIAIQICPDGLCNTRTAGAIRPLGRLPGQDYTLEIVYSCASGLAEICLKDDNTALQGKAVFAQNVIKLERIVFSTKRLLPWNTLEDQGAGQMLPDLPSDEPTEMSWFGIRSLTVMSEPLFE